jgi:hypothetical protein
VHRSWPELLEKRPTSLPLQGGAALVLRNLSVLPVWIGIREGRDGSSIMEISRVGLCGCLSLAGPGSLSVLVGNTKITSR